ncbi:hypothetical protein I4U23_014743 [Adineta vaga]|nr:hypothetical protein I4U23_014743 [Adineta vaga]
MSMSNSSYVVHLIVAAQNFTIISTWTNFFLGFIGNLLNIVVFIKLKIFHQNRCAFYLIVESFVDIGQLSQYFANQVWILTSNRVEPVTISLLWCKLRIIIPQWCRLMLAAIVCFAAIDQFLSTHHRLRFRQSSSLKIAKYQIYFASFICLLHTIPFGVLQYIHSTLGCIISDYNLTSYYSYVFYPFINGLFPILISSVFSLLAFRNVRRIIQRQIPVERRKLDQQLTAMIFSRVIAFVLLQLPFTVYRIYYIRSITPPGNTLAYAIDRWVNAISLTFMYGSHGGNFYIFYATSTRYRRQVKYFLMKKCRRILKEWCVCNRNSVHPFERVVCETSGQLELE